MLEGNILLFSPAFCHSSLDLKCFSHIIHRRLSWEDDVYKLEQDAEWRIEETVTYFVDLRSRI